MLREKDCTAMTSMQELAKKNCCVCEMCSDLVDYLKLKLLALWWALCAKMCKCVVELTIICELCVFLAPLRPSCGWSRARHCC